MARKPKMTLEERRAYGAKMRAELEAVMRRAYGALETDPQFWVAVVRTAARLQDRSPVNVVAITAQFPAATCVMSAGDWKKVGRRPVRGSSAIRVWTPIKRRSAVEDGEDVDGEPTPSARVQGRVSGYKAGPVFDITQTEGEAYDPPLALTPPPAEVVRDVLAGQYLEYYEEEPQEADDFGSAEDVPDGAVRALLFAHAWRRIDRSDAPLPGQREAEAASAAHLAALLLGVAPGPVAVPPVAGVLAPGDKPLIRESVIRVIETGRAIADAVQVDANAPDIVGDYGAAEPVSG
ncbi:hypothetical protein [Streptomyces sp. LPB2020-019-1HS]|uniref:hypothetical protein n=1 Tax=Streptomyces sp. LPB2020-019-1HS TaxID=3409689 RepID=UPI003B67EF41